MRIFIITYLLSCSISFAQSQDSIWNGKKSAVILTYDDALACHIDEVIPSLDSLQLKATFYLSGTLLQQRASSWKKAAANGHELGNHTVYHPCAGKSKGRNWVSPEFDLDHYSVDQILKEIHTANQILDTLTQDSLRSFAYTCGDMHVGDSSFVDSIKSSFIAARGVVPAYLKIDEIDLFNVNASSINRNTSEDLINRVKENQQKGTLLVFLFHGVGGGHSLAIKTNVHQDLINYLKQHESEIWVAPFATIMSYVKSQQENEK